MEINREALRKLAELSDSELEEKILSLAETAGVPRETARGKIGDIGKLKKKLQSVTDSEIRLMMLAIGEKNAALIREKLSEGGK